MIKYTIKQDELGFICDPYYEGPDDIKTAILYKIGWGDTREEAIENCKQRNNFKRDT